MVQPLSSDDNPPSFILLLHRVTVMGGERPHTSQATTKPFRKVISQSTTAQCDGRLQHRTSALSHSPSFARWRLMRPEEGIYGCDKQIIPTSNSLATAAKSKSTQ